MQWTIYSVIKVLEAQCTGFMYWWGYGLWGSIRSCKVTIPSLRPAEAFGLVHEQTPSSLLSMIVGLLATPTIQTE